MSSERVDGDQSMFRSQNVKYPQWRCRAEFDATRISLSVKMSSDMNRVGFSPPLCSTLSTLGDLIFLRVQQLFSSLQAWLSVYRIRGIQLLPTFPTLYSESRWLEKMSVCLLSPSSCGSSWLTPTLHSFTPPSLPAPYFFLSLTSPLLTLTFLLIQ